MCILWDIIKFNVLDNSDVLDWEEKVRWDKGLIIIDQNEQCGFSRIHFIERKKKVEYNITCIMHVNQISSKAWVCHMTLIYGLEPDLQIATIIDPKI